MNAGRLPVVVLFFGHGLDSVAEGRHGAAQLSDLLALILDQLQCEFKLLLGAQAESSLRSPWPRWVVRVFPYMRTKSCRTLVLGMFRVRARSESSSCTSRGKLTVVVTVLAILKSACTIASHPLCISIDAERTVSRQGPVLCSGIFSRRLP